MLDAGVGAGSGISGDPHALRAAASDLESSADAAEAILRDINAASASVLGGWDAPSAAGLELLSAEARTCAVALIEAGRGAGPPLREYADDLEQARLSYSQASDDARSAGDRTDAAENGSSEQGEAREDMYAAHDAMSAARDAALAANERAAAIIEALTASLPPAPQVPGLASALLGAGLGLLADFFGLGESRTSPFDAQGRIVRLDLTVEDFDRMTVAERLQWIQQFQRQYSAEFDIDGWFANIEGILGFAEDKDIGQTGSWFSLVDASILHGIQGGMALALGRSTTSPNPGAARWETFFLGRALDRPGGRLSEAESRQLWGAAEQASTDYGTDFVAPSRGQSPTSTEQIFLGIGDFYRSEVLGEGGGGDLFDPRNREFTQDSAEAIYDYFGEGEEFLEETGREGGEALREVGEAPWYRKPDQTVEGVGETAWEGIEGSGEILGQAGEGLWETGDDLIANADDVAEEALDEMGDWGLPPLIPPVRLPWP